ncbi:hypothetical protein [Sporosarcina sp. Te-1]|uniref:hypothetical protein n=1 Tax=Sporosarcina sp. Te-1 TaxID=2818390 RepID=UPI001A9D6AF9|nr:hypothetical protein [Sporosarcina sp. Te-1]QTD39706.1 hypothetical protein J3U78_12750 [Sporosarcina sp. Te-1]
MNKFLPSELRDLSDSKKRVIQKVTIQMEKTLRQPKRRWPAILMTSIIVSCIMVFAFQAVLDGQNPSSLREESLETIDKLAKPSFTMELGAFYLNGITKGDSPGHVIDRLGEGYTLISDLDGTGADVGLDYGNRLKVFFYKNQVDTMFLTEVDPQFAEQLYRDYGGIKFISEDTIRFMYSMEKLQLIKMEYDGEGKMSVGLMGIEPNFAEHPGLVLQPEVPGHSMRISLDPSQPILSDANGIFYLHGLTLSDPQSKVTQYFGDDYNVQYEVEDAEYTMSYGDEMEFNFILGKLQSIRFLKVDEAYFNHVLAGFEGVDLYSEKTSQMISTKHSEDGDLIVSLHYAK